jgi:V8-like Glu-specific endopeptidase
MFLKKLAPILLISLTLLSTACEENQQQLADAEGTHLNQLILGKDDRVKAYNHPSRLGRSTGLIQSRHKSGRISTCTGTILNDSYVLTAAHCVIDSQTKKPKLDIFFIPRTLYKNQMPFGRFPVNKVYIPKTYLNFDSSTFRSTQYDMALVKFHKNKKGENLREKTGAGIGFWGLRRLTNPNVTTIGYPGDKPSWTPYRQENCRIFEFDDYMYSSTCDVYQGQSGSALVAYSKKYKQSFIHGVHASDSSEKQLNLVTKITATRERVMANIMNGDLDSALNDEETWVELKAYVSLGVNVIVENACTNRRTFYGAIVYQETNGKTVHRATTIKPGHSINLGLVPNKQFKLGLKIKGGGQISFTDKRATVAYRYRSYGTIDFFDYKVSSTSDLRFVINNCY